MEPLVLTVDMAGLPQAWVALEEAITHHAKQMVAWSLGHAGPRIPRRLAAAAASVRGLRPSPSSPSKGTGAGAHLHAPGLTNPMLFARDRQLCAYCGKRYLARDLSRDHVVPFRVAAEIPGPIP